MKKLSLLVVLALMACGSGQPSARENAQGTPASGEEVILASDSATFYRDGLSGVDFSGMDAVKKERSLKILNAQGCDCGCGMTIAQCRVEDKTCPRSPSLAAAVVNAIRSGATDQQALASLKALIDGGDEPGPAPAARPVPVAQIATANSPALGPEDAAIVVVTFEDFQCPYCSRATPALKKLVQDNPDVRLVYKHYPLPNHARARPAAIASVAAQRQNRFWEMHDLLFQNQRSLDDANIRQFAQSIGLDMARFEKDIADPAIARFVDDEALEARRVGVTGTPNTFVNGVKSPSWDERTMQRLIESARRGDDVGKEAGIILADLNKQRGTPRNNARQPDNTVYQIDLVGSPSKGPANAAVTIVEFSDYQCPYCASAEPLLAQVMEAYPNDVRLVYKHFPLSFHQNAMPASEAAVFAMKQGKFWEMHEKLFQNSRTLSMETFKKLGAELGLNAAALETSVSGSSFKSIIEKDMADGRKANVTGTPSIFINGKKLPRRDFATFKQVIDGILAEKGAEAAASR
jgi:protein-disulfide isomerase